MRDCDVWDVNLTKTSGISSGDKDLISNPFGAEILALFVVIEPVKDLILSYLHSSWYKNGPEETGWIIV